MLENLRFGELPVGRRQHHHRIGAVFLGKARTANGAGGGQVGDADDGRYPPGNVAQAERGHLLPFQVAQVGAFAGAAEGGDGMHAAVDQAIDRAAEGVEVKLLAVGTERGDGVADDAVKSLGHEIYSAR
ncbi:hypothetical protein D3C72_1815610 [compost metagenome]